MPIKVTLAAAVASLLLMQLSCCNASGDEEGVELEEHKPLETSAVWGYSFLFNFLVVYLQPAPSLSASGQS
jgi:hypothetical protein